MNEAKNLACPECGGILEEVRYPSNSMLNREQWESCIIGDLYCSKCKPERYYWKSKLAGGRKPEPSKTGETKHVCISDLLESLRGRFKERAKMSLENEQAFHKQKKYTEALIAATRTDIWEYAAEMVEQEKLSNEKLSHGPANNPKV